MFVSLLVISAMTGVTVTQAAARSRRRKRRIPASVALSGTRSKRLTVKQLENHFHNYVERKIDHLLGDVRTQQLQQLNQSSSTEISAENKRDNRYLLATGMNAGTALLLGVVAPAWLFVTVPVSLYLVRFPFQGAWYSLRHEGKLSVHVIDATAVCLSALMGFWRVMACSLFLYMIALKLLRKIKHNSRQRLSNAFAQAPSEVWVQRGNTEVRVPLLSLQSDELVVVHAGETIPVDGVIQEGGALVDQRVLTGESQPVDKLLGDEVFACTLLLRGHITLRVNNAGKATLASSISEMLTKTAEYKNQHESRAENFADRSVIPTLALSALAFPVCGASGAIGVLWSCFGYNMRLISPMSVMSFLRSASEQQILIKDGQALDQLGTVDTVVFDKTGTLTSEVPEVSRIHCFAHYDEEYLLSWAASIEQRQTHPIAQAILAEASAREVVLVDALESHCHLGYGIEAQIEGVLVKLGSMRFMEASGVVIPKAAYTLQNNAEAAGYSIVMVSIANVLAGAIELRPNIRPAAKHVIQYLKAKGVKTYIISGDCEQPTRWLSERLAVDQYFANTLPEQKAVRVRQLQQEGRTVCFIGDGINDAIALRQADVSVSLSGATRAATDTAQVVLMDADLGHLLSLIEMGTLFQKNQKKNMYLSVFPAVISIGGIFIFKSGLVLAALMFYGSMALGIKNAIQPVTLSKQHSKK